jgi:glycosyltransferase involved in cell wall biosynthesis
MIKLSVILPCFNGAATIETQLEALANQQWSEPWEVIVVNNGSTDRSMDIVAQYRDRLPYLQIVDAHTPGEPRKPVAHSYNSGIRAAKGEAFAFCEADDEVAPGWVAAMGNALAEYDFVAGRLEYSRLNPSWLVAAYGSRFGARPQESGLLGDATVTPPRTFGSGCNLGMRRSLYQTVGELRLDYLYVYDTEYCWKAQMAGFHLHFAPDAVIHYRLRHQVKALFWQAYRWGKESPRLYVTYGAELGALPVSSRLAQLVPYVCKGLYIFLKSLFHIPGSKGSFAIWGWCLGYRVGEIRGLLQDFPLMNDPQS